MPVMSNSSSRRFVDGENKVRPGVYFREVNSLTNIPNVRNGVVAMALKSDWGKLGEVITLTSPDQIYAAFGTDNNIVKDAFIGGASVVKAVRVGTGGTAATITLKDTTSGTAADAVTLTAACVGARDLKVTIRDSLSSTSLRECILYDGTRELVTVTFAKGGAGTAECDALVAAINAEASWLVTAEKESTATTTLAAVNQSAFTAGTSPTVTTTDYEDAFTVLEADTWNVLCVDTNDTAVHTLVKSFIERANDNGILAFAVIGEPSTVTYEDRLTHASAFNSCDIVYCLNGFTIDGVDYEGYKAAAVAAGLLAYLPASVSPTHKVIPGATAVVAPLTNSQVVDCLNGGALVFTRSTTGNVQIEQGINTLNVLSPNQDPGWKKIRRTKTRYELINRISAECETVIGDVNNDSNGRATIVAKANGIINEMIAEGKLVTGAVTEDPANAPSGDSAWFIVSVVDFDSIEKIYITYKFRFEE